MDKKKLPVVEKYQFPWKQFSFCALISVTIIVLISVFYKLTSLTAIFLSITILINIPFLLFILTQKNILEQSPLKGDERFRSTLDNMLEGCQILSTEWKYLYLNKAAEVHNRRPNEELVGRVYMSMWPGIEETEVFGLIKKCMEERISQHLENEFIFPDGSKGWFDIRINRIPEGIFILSIDITDRKNAESARIQVENSLKTSEELYRNLFENMLNGFAYCRMIYENGNPVDFIYLNVNEAFGNLTGLKNVTGKKVSEVIPGIMETDPGLISTYSKVALTGEPEVFEVYVEAMKMWFSISVYSPKKEYFVAVFDMISERKKIESALLESEDKFKYVFDHSPIGKSITLPSGEINVNKAFCQMFGYSAEELSVLKWQDITHPDDYEINQKSVNSLLEGRSSSERFIKRYIHKNGSVIWTDVSTSLRRDSKGNPLYFMTTVNDITELKHAEDTLRIEEKRLRNIIESLPQLFWTCRYDGPCDYLSTQWIDYTGIPESEQLGYGWLEQLHPDDQERTIAEWNKKVKSCEIFDIEFRIRRKDGEYHWFQTRAVPLRNTENNITKWLGANTDIDSIRKAEAQLINYNKDLEQSVIKRTEQLEMANKELEAFSYSVSHDLRSPLRSVHGFSNILMQDYGKELDDEGRRICGIISSSAVQMSQLIDDLLNFSRIGRTSMNPTQLDMGSIAASVISELKTMPENNKVKFTLPKLLNAWGDSNLMKHVWKNLLANAVKYSSKAEIPKIIIKSCREGDTIIYSVRDNGVGFDMGYVDKLFGVFQRLHSEAEFEGNGVGLAIVQRIVMKHGGRVWAEGKVGKGAVFHFTLPHKERYEV